MRLWSLHPKYLDCKGIVALWREALLARAVLRGETRGYLHHPQLQRFRESASPCDAIAAYLREVCAEASRRGYRFDATKAPPGPPVPQIEVTRGQLDYEWRHLKEKLGVRAPGWLEGIEGVSSPDPHPLFRVVPGPVAAWESVRRR